MPNIVIDRRFRGPPNSGNGGYVCGLMSKQLGQSEEKLGAEVTLHKPIPLDIALAVSPGADHGIELHSEGILLATAKASDLMLDELPRASFAEASEASRATPFDENNHDVSGCFVCGPGRAEGDGLRILAGPLQTAATAAAIPYASHWLPDGSLAAADGLVAEEFIWACLDCPTGHAVLGGNFGEGDSDESVLLGRMATRVMERPRPGEACVITALQGARSGRKLLADSALYGAAGNLLAFARATWITVPRSMVVA